MLELRQIGMRFGGLAVLEGLDLDLAAGEVLGILGPNGAGKSTLFNVIAGVLAPSAGRIVYQGRDVTRLKVWSRSRLGIGRTYQIPKPFGHMTVFENALVAAVQAGQLPPARAREEAEAVLERVGLAARHGWPAARLGLLDLKRLELAKALSQRPRLLLLDEIAGGLTEPECDALLAILREVHAGGITIVWIEHVLHALRRAATRLAVLYGGSFLVTGAPEEVVRDARVKQVYLGA